MRRLRAPPKDEVACDCQHKPKERAQCRYILREQGEGGDAARLVLDVGEKLVIFKELTKENAFEVSSRAEGVQRAQS